MSGCDTLSIAILVGRDSKATRLAIESVARLPNVRVAAVLIDIADPRVSVRGKNLLKNIRRNGLRYVPTRILTWANERLDSMASKVVPEREVQQLLRSAFPDRLFNLAELAERFGFTI